MDNIIILCNSHSKHVKDILVINYACYELGYNKIIFVLLIDKEVYRLFLSLLSWSTHWAKKTLSFVIVASPNKPIILLKGYV